MYLFIYRKKKTWSSQLWVFKLDLKRMASFIAFYSKKKGEIKLSTSFLKYILNGGWFTK